MVLGRKRKVSKKVSLDIENEAYADWEELREDNVSYRRTLACDSNYRRSEDKAHFVLLGL